MKSIICPHCGHKIVAARLAHTQSAAVKKVLKLARKPTAIYDLVLCYLSVVNEGCDTAIEGVTYRSARKAIERLSTDGYLTRVGPGIYQASKR